MIETKPARIANAARALPHSAESERAVLAAVLLSPHVLPTAVAGRLRPADFYLDRHELVYKAMLELDAGGVEIDLRTLQDRLEHRGCFEKIGGMAFLAGLDLDLPDLGRVETYVELVKERSRRRRLIRGLTAIADGLFDGGGLDSAEATEQIQALALGVGADTSGRSPAALEELYEETLVQLEERCGGKLLGTPSGFPDWDRLTEGLVPGNLIIVAGRPTMGKTSFALDVARHVAVHQALPAVVFSLEMGGHELTQRLLAAESGLPFADLRAGRLSEREWTTLYDTVRRTLAAPLYVDDAAAPTLPEIAARARRLKTEQGLALVVIDYLQLLQAGRRHENRQQEVTALSRALKVLAKELEVPVLVISQLSRKPEERVKNHRPMLSDLRESGAIEQDADLVCFVYRDEVYRKDEEDVKGLAELIVEKNRNGPTGTVELVFVGERTTFRNRSPRTDP